MNTPNLSTAALVDRMGDLKAQIADRTNEVEQIKTILVDRVGEGKAEGQRYRVAISNTLRSKTDWQSVALALAKKAGIRDSDFDKIVSERTDMADTWVARVSARLGGVKAE